MKNCIKTINLKYQLQHGMINSNYLVDHINPSMKTFLDRIENGNTFKTKSGYHV